MVLIGRYCTTWRVTRLSRCRMQATDVPCSQGWADSGPADQPEWQGRRQAPAKVYVAQSIHRAGLNEGSLEDVLDSLSGFHVG